ncbi:hypothetical protein IJ732_04665, partial [bacterium]|nr:hypothetical protein [bacterium]
DFKTKFESHLKTTGCDADAGVSYFTRNVCLADGSQFAYGTFDVSFTDNICDTLTIDTNGKKGPNTAGKDRFTMNLTPNGVKALGESDSCENGLDCGAYILAHHKLWSGDVVSNSPVYNVANCKSTTETECTKCNSGYYVDTTNGQCIPAEGKATITINNETKDYYISSVNSEYSPSGKVPNTDYDDYLAGAEEECQKKGMTLPDIDTLKELYKQRGTNGIPDSGFMWSTTTDPTERWAEGLYFESTDTVTWAEAGKHGGDTTLGDRRYAYSFICVSED